MHIVNQITSSWDEKGIKYLHFKSNKNLNMSFAGKGDFDILVDKRRLADVEKTLTECGAKRFNKVRYGVYPGVDNWLLFDKESGLLHHLHLHYQLASGKKLLKEYTIPWDGLLFETRLRDPDYQIFISHPAAELLLLTVRSVIKARLSDYLKACCGLYRTHPSLGEERQELIGRVDAETLKNYAGRLFADAEPEEVASISMDPRWNSCTFLRANRIVRRELSAYRRYSGLTSTLKSARLNIGDKWNKLLRRKFGCRRIENKVSLSGGLIIAFVGVDGSGKSTTKETIYKWMRSQIECKRFYMGTGDGKVNPVAYMLKKARDIKRDRPAEAKASNKETSGEVTEKKSKKTFLRKLAAAIMVYSVEKSNRKKLIEMNRYRSEGGFSLLDRYPQIESEGQNDGPKIVVYRDMFSSSRILNYLCRKERDMLDIVRTIKPDLVLRLNISAETSMARKPEQTDISAMQRKIDELHEITFQNARIIDINAEQPYDQELLEIKKYIWENI